MRKLFFNVFIIIILIVSINVFYFHHKVLNETFIETFDPNQNITSEPENKTSGLYLKSSNPEDIQNFVIKMVNNALQISKNNQIPGPPGPPGPPGKHGENGGMYQRVGSLYNLSDKNLYLERTAGMGKGAVIFGNNRNSQQWQQWELTKDGKLVSVYDKNNCIDVDEKGNVFMGSCINSPVWTHRSTTGQLMLNQAQGDDMKKRCLTIGDTENIRTNGVLQVDKKTNPTKMSAKIVKLADCKNGELRQQWQWL